MLGVFDTSEVNYSDLTDILTPALIGSYRVGTAQVLHKHVTGGLDESNYNVLFCLFMKVDASIEGEQALS